jgi:hypothetical protein
MKIQLVGYDYNINRNYKLDLFTEIVNGSDADLILFPGHTLRDEYDTEYVEPDITNDHSLVVLELEDGFPSSCMRTRNELFLLKEGLFEDTFSSQVLATAKDIQTGGEILMGKLLDEILRRQFECCGKRITVLQCGETALLASSKDDGYKAAFRFKDNKVLNEKYEAILASTDIFLNPIHDLQGEQGVMAQRRLALSANGRYYFSTCALNEEMEGNFSSKRLQYAMHNGEEITEKAQVYKDEFYISRIFEI